MTVNDNDKPKTAASAAVEKPKDGEKKPKDSTATAGAATSKVLNVLKYKKALSKAESMSCVALSEEEASTMLGQDETKGETLAYLRQKLFDKKALTARRSRYPFCTQEGAVVGDTTQIKAYISMLGDSTGTDGKGQTVYILSERTAMDDTTKAFLDAKHDLDLKANRPDLIKAEAKELTSSFSRDAFRAKAATGTITHPADMSEKQWSIVVRANSLCNAYKVLYKTEETSGSDKSITLRPEDLERSMFTAFAVTERRFSPHEISFAQVGKEHDITLPPSAYRIPRFRIDDDSNVDVYETKTRLETSMADSSFSKTSIEASAGGGAFGFSLGASMGFAKSDESKSAQTSTADVATMHIRYDFPRVVVQLDEHCIELSEECKDEINNVLRTGKFEALQKFSDKFGHFFATRIHLGGTLYSSEASESFGNASSASKASSMKASASLSFSSPYAQASLSASHETQDVSASDNKNSKFAKSIVWKAKGGDTLLCNDPPSWCPTVASFYNWRIVKQDKIVPLIDLIGKLQGYETVPVKFAEIAQSKYPKMVEVPIKFTLQKQGQQEYLIVDQERQLTLPEVWTSAMKDLSDTDDISDWISDIMGDEKRDLVFSSTAKAPERVFKTMAVAAEADKSKVNTLQYNTQYTLKHELTDLEIGTPPNMLRPYVLASPWKTTFRFQTPGTNKKEGPIHEGDEVELLVLNPMPRGIVRETTPKNKEAPQGTKVLEAEPWSYTERDSFIRFKISYKV